MMVFFRQPRNIIALDIDGVLIPSSARDGKPVYSVYNQGLVPPTVEEAVKVLTDNNMHIMWFTSWDAATANQTFEWLGLGKLRGIRYGGSVSSPMVEQKTAGLREFSKSHPKDRIVIFDDEVDFSDSRIKTIPVDPKVGLTLSHAVAALRFFQKD